MEIVVYQGLEKLECNVKYYKENVGHHSSQIKMILEYFPEITLKLKLERQQRVYMFEIWEFGKGFSGRGSKQHVLQPRCQEELIQEAK